MLNGVELSWSGIILLLGAGQFFIVAPALYLVNTRNLLSKSLFILLLGSFSASFLEILLYGSMQLFKLYPDLIAYLTPFTFLSPVLLFFFVKSHSNSNFIFRMRDAWHLLPVLILSSPAFYYLSLSVDEQLALYQTLEGYEVGNQWEDYVEPFYFLLYLIPSIIVSVKRNSSLDNEYSFREKVSVSWLICILALLGLLSIVRTLNLILGIVTNFHFVVAYVAIIYVLGLMAFRHNLNLSKIESEFSAIHNSSGNSQDSLPAQPKILEAQISQKSEKRYATKINEVLLRQIEADLVNGMNMQLWFLDPYLTLKKLALHVNVHPNYVSRTINECFNQTFFEYVNLLRVEHCKALMRDRPSGNTLELALESGFNSKSAFYTAFKKYVGCSPRDFKKQLSFETEP